jgi:hypothetical protein
MLFMSVTAELSIYTNNNVMHLFMKFGNQRIYHSHI